MEPSKKKTMRRSDERNSSWQIPSRLIPLLRTAQSGLGWLWSINISPLRGGKLGHVTWPFYVKP